MLQLGPLGTWRLFPYTELYTSGHLCNMVITYNKKSIYDMFQHKALWFVWFTAH